MSQTNKTHKTTKYKFTEIASVSVDREQKVVTFISDYGHAHKSFQIMENIPDECFGLINMGFNFLESIYNRRRDVGKRKRIGKEYHEIVRSSIVSGHGSETIYAKHGVSQYKKGDDAYLVFNEIETGQVRGYGSFRNVYIAYQIISTAQQMASSEHFNKKLMERAENEKD